MFVVLTAAAGLAALTTMRRVQSFRVGGLEMDLSRRWMPASLPRFLGDRVTDVAAFKDRGGQGAVMIVAALARDEPRPPAMVLGGAMAQMRLVPDLRAQSQRQRLEVGALSGVRYLELSYRAYHGAPVPRTTVFAVVTDDEERYWAIYIGTKGLKPRGALAELVAMFDRILQGARIVGE